MPDLSLYKVDLDTPQPNGRTGESPHAAFTKYNEALEEIEGGFVPAEAGKGLSTNDYDNTAKQKVDGMGGAASRDVTTSATDTTAGRLLKVGDFGQTGNVILAGSLDANTLVRKGSYWVSSASTNTPIAFAGVLEVTSSLSTTEIVTSQRFTLSATGSTRTWFRSKTSSGSWLPWREIYHTGNAVGPVSQLEGIPTGGLMQYGETPNGSFFRYADGHQVCLPPSVFYSLTEGSQFIWTFPASFTSTPQVNTQISSANSTSGFEQLVLKIGGELPTSSNTRAVILYSLAAGANQFNSRLGLIAIGRWF